MKDPSLTTLAEELKNKARQLGAQDAGLAPAEALPESSAYSDWIAEGRQAGMEYLAKNSDARRDITAWYPQAKTVLVCAFSYAGNAPRETPPGQGQVARYAAHPDYHTLIRDRLGLLLDWIKKRESGADGRVFVDTSPVLERLYARYSGIGWIGKNTMLISKKRGSYLFLGGIALNLDLKTDRPEPDHCGSCRRCIEACPTDAFPKERVLDAGRCIAYFTIEHKGSIPEEFRKGVGDWILGCDICQEVCPWNRFAAPGPLFAAPSESALDLEELAALDDKTFKERFGKTPLERPKRRGMLRNTLLAMGNSGQERFRKILERCADDADPVIAEQARWSLARLKI